MPIVYVCTQMKNRFFLLPAYLAKIASVFHQKEEIPFFFAQQKFHVNVLNVRSTDE